MTFRHIFRKENEALTAIFDLIIVVTVSFGLLCSNLTIIIFTDKATSIPYDYIIICSIFFTIFPLRDSFRSPSLPRPFLRSLALFVLLFGFSTLTLWRSALSLELIITPLRFEQIASILYVASVINLLASNLPTLSQSIAVKTDIIIWYGMPYMAKRSIPAGILTFFTYILTKYENSVMNHATLFCAFLALVILVLEGVQRNLRTNRIDDNNI